MTLVIKVTEIKPTTALRNRWHKVLENLQTMYCSSGIVVTYGITLSIKVLVIILHFK